MKAKKQHEVIVYSTTTCPWCVRAKEYFDSKKIKYKDLNVGIDAKARAEMVQKSGQMGVPVIQIDNYVIVGFDQAAIEDVMSR